MSEQQTTLHYVYDPLCGWCYGAAPLLQAAATIVGLKIELHAGGLWLGSRRQPMGEALRDYVRPHDQRIEALTGQHFGERYFNELLLREGRLLDSEQPIRAVLAVTALGGDGLAMLHRIQQSHYRDGIWIGEDCCRGIPASLSAGPLAATSGSQPGLDAAARRSGVSHSWVDAQRSGSDCSRGRFSGGSGWSACASADAAG